MYFALLYISGSKFVQLGWTNGTRTFLFALSGLIKKLTINNQNKKV